MWRDPRGSGATRLAVVLVAASALARPPAALAQDEEEEEIEEEEGDAEGEEEEDGEEEDEGSLEQREHTDIRFDIHATLGYYAEVGGGLRVDIPIIRNGILDALDDDISLTLGAEILYFYHSEPVSQGIAVYPMLAFQWNFYLSETWSLMAEIGATLIFAPNRDRFYPAFIAPHGMFGLRWHISEHNALFVRAGWPEGVQLGLAFWF